MKTKSEILESHIHPTKFMSSLSTETGKLAIFNSMDEHAKQIAMEFFNYIEQNNPAIKKGELSELFDKFMAERFKPTCDVCGSSNITDAPHMGRNCNDCHPV